MSKLFTPVQIGALDLGHRVVHAPTTRLRTLADETPSPMMVDYYRQRASQGGLLGDGEQAAVAEGMAEWTPNLRAS